MTVLLVDTGPLIALLDRRDRYHGWVRDTLDAVRPPLLTCEPVVTEAFFVLQRLSGGREAVLDLLTKQIVASASDRDRLDPQPH